MIASKLQLQINTSHVGSIKLFHIDNIDWESHRAAENIKKKQEKKRKKKTNRKEAQNLAGETSSVCMVA